MDSSLSGKIKQSYPFPIAVYYKRFSKVERDVKKGRDDYKKLFDSMIDLFEMTTRFLSIVSLSSYVKDGMFNDTLNERISELITKKMSLGHWFELFRETTRAYKNNPDKLFIPELVPFLFERKTIQLFDQFINIRNLNKGHGLTLPPAKYKQLYENNLKNLHTILERLQFLVDYKIISPIEIDNDGYVITVFNEFMGDSINEMDGELAIVLQTKEEEIILVKENDSAKYDALLLSPLTYYGFLEDYFEEYLFLNEHNKLNKQELKKLEYIGINATAKTKRIAVHEDEESRLMWFEMFKEILGKMLQINEQMVQHTALSVQAQIRVKDYYFHDQKTLMQNYSRHYITRPFIQRVIEQIQQEHASGYFLLIGSPGQGKTAIAADLVQKHDNAVHHFISRNGGRNNEHAMILSLMQQMGQKMNVDIEPSQDPNDLKREFAHLIESYSEFLLKEGKKEILIIDGLDELDGSDDHLTLSYFPDFVPSNIFIIILSRPINQLVNLKGKITQEFHVPAMSIHEVRKLISTVHNDLNEDLVSSLFYYSQGNPLLLKGILQELGTQTYIDIKKIPDSIEEVFDHFIDDLYHTEDFVAIDILGLLSCTVGGLSLNSIASILKQRKHYIVKSIKRLEQFLVSFGGKIQLYHKKLSEYLLNPSYKYSFSTDDIKQYEDMLIDYSLQHLEHPSDFMKENLIRLLYKRGKINQFNDIFQIEEFQTPAIAFLTELFRSREGEDVLQTLFQHQNESNIKITVAAVEQAVSYGELNYSEKVLLQYLDKIDSPLYQSNVHYLLALIYKERGQLQQAFHEFHYIRTHLNDYLTKREQLFVAFEFANTAREFAEADTANETYQEIFNKASIDNEAEAEFYIHARRYLLNREHVQGRYIDADKGFKEVIEIAHNKGLKNIWADVLKTYGLVYFEQEKYEEAAEIFTKAMHVYKERNDLINLGRIYNDLSETFVYMNLDKATYYAEKAFEINTKIQKKLEIANSYRCFAIISLHKNETEEALGWIEQAIALCREIGYKSGVGKANYHKAVILFKLGKIDEVIDAVDETRKWFVRKNSLSHGVYVVKSLLLQTVLYEQMDLEDKIPELHSKFPHIEPFEGMELFKERMLKKFRSM